MDKLKLYERLGAKHFQKFVLNIEKIKYSVIEVLFPNIDVWYNKNIDKKLEKQCKKLYSEEAISRLKRDALNNKLMFKKELNTKKNRNYHLDYHNPEKFISYLKWNKDVHKRGLIANALFIAITMPLSFMVTGPLQIVSIALLGYNILGTAVNFECINLQNYNLLRINSKLDKLKSIQRRREEKEIASTKDFNKIIASTMENKTSIPSIDEVIEKSKDKGQLEVLLNILKQEQNKRNIISKGEKHYVIHK